VEFLSAVCSDNDYNYESFSYESGVNTLYIYFIVIKCIKIKKNVQKIKPMIKKYYCKKSEEKRKSINTILGSILLYSCCDMFWLYQKPSPGIYKILAESVPIYNTRVSPPCH
jgi:dolichol kinase